MINTEFDKAKVIKYLLFTFVIAYIIQVLIALLYKNAMASIGQLVAALMMFIPTLGVLFSGSRLKNMGWKPQIRKNIKLILASWFAPAFLTVIGAMLYFIVFPNHFDISGNYLIAAIGEETYAQLEAQGFSYSVYILACVISCVTYAPLLNGIFGLGEEIGWRGFLYKELKAKFGRNKGWVLGGIIWGAWHWPLIWLIGYEYGAAAGNSAGYFGYPIVGMLLFCVITICLGTLCDYLYEKSESIWLPAICHGAFNAIATVPIAACIRNTGTFRLLGPAPNGIIAGIPLFIVAIVLLSCKNSYEK